MGNGDGKSATRPDVARAERDRFVAFAFCWADALFELDSGERIVFAAGATRSLAGRDPGELLGGTFMELVAERDRPLARQLMKVARRHGRIENAAVRLAGATGSTPPLALAGYQLDDLGDHFFLALRSDPAAVQTRSGEVPLRDTQSGLFGAETFSEVASRQLKAAREAGEAAELTLVSVPGYARLSDRLDKETGQNLLGVLGAALRANSINGDAAARVADDRYALVHEASLSAADLARELNEASREVDPEGEGLTTETATLEVGEAALDDESLANGLVYAINRFKDAKGADFSLKNFSSNLSGLVDEAVDSVRTFKDVLAHSGFDVAFHPIINVRTGEIHHYEALARFQHMKSGASPYEYITFAEETGQIWKFDLAMARKVIEWLSERRDEKTRVAVNISGFSMGTPQYLAQLLEMLEVNFWTRSRLLFEVTESSRITNLASANRFIQTLREEGYEVCLDDFGAGAASFQYLSTLEVDVVKLDGSAVANARSATKGMAFLTALVRLCQNLGVETIAEMIDQKEGLDFVRTCGVDYVQGFLFGEPSRDIASFAKTRQRHLFPNAPGVTARRPDFSSAP